MTNGISLKLNQFAARVTNSLNALAILLIIVAFIMLVIVTLIYLLQLNSSSQLSLNVYAIAGLISGGFVLGYILFFIGILSQIILIQSHLEAIRMHLEKNAHRENHYNK